VLKLQFWYQWYLTDRNRKSISKNPQLQSIKLNEPFNKAKKDLELKKKSTRNIKYFSRTKLEISRCTFTLTTSESWMAASTNVRRNIAESCSRIEKPWERTSKHTIRRDTSVTYHLLPRWDESIVLWYSEDERTAATPIGDQRTSPLSDATDSSCHSPATSSAAAGLALAFFHKLCSSSYFQSWSVPCSK